jgi:hypothetical protein
MTMRQRWPGGTTMPNQPYEFDPAISAMLSGLFAQWRDSTQLHEKTMSESDQLVDMDVMFKSWPRWQATMTLVCSASALIISMLVLVH